MPGLLAETELEGVAKEIFLARLSVIHNAIADARAARASGPSLPAGSVLAADPT